MTPCNSKIILDMDRTLVIFLAHLSELSVVMSGVSSNTISFTYEIEKVMLICS